MDIKDMSRNGSTSDKRMEVSSTTPSGGLTNVSGTDNSPVNMNTPSPKPRAYRCDQLVETMGDDSYDLGGESPRHTKMVG